MSNETFLISMKQNNDLSKAAITGLRVDLAQHPLNQRKYIQLAALPGNSRQYSVNNVQTNLSSPLMNKNVLFLGSSVTLGFGGLNESFVDYLWKKDGVRAIKDAENGTTLAEPNNPEFESESYVNRFRAELSEPAPDAFVLQLSTNDATKNMPLGQIENGPNYNPKTVTGALEFIFSQVQRKWQCPILVFTNPYFNNSLYSKMVQRTRQLQDKYNFELLDLYHDPDFNQQNKIYMADEIHPTRAGYLEKWLPLFEKKLVKIIN